MSDLWGPIDPRRWRDTPSLTAHVAREDDVRAGIAVFHLEDPERIGAKPMDLGLPRCAIWHDDDGADLPVIVVQAEEAEGKTYVGVRFLGGGNGLCTRDELDLLDEPDERFVASGEK